MNTNTNTNLGANNAETPNHSAATLTRARNGAGINPIRASVCP